MNEDIKAIDGLLEGLRLAVVDGNADALGELLCAQATAFFTGSAGVVRGRAALVETWRKHMSQWTEVAVERRDTLVRIHGDVAWAHFLWDGEGTAQGGRYRLEGERWSVVMLWEEDGWRFAQMHTSMPYANWEAHRL